MGFDVKNTTKIGLLDLFCPHTCRGCGALGSVFCECCKKHMLVNRRNVCPICKNVVENLEQKCRDCENPLQGLYVGGFREGALAKLVREFKYHSVRAAGEVLLQLLLETVPKNLGGDGRQIVVVPLPTIGRHVRQRGVDHTDVLARKLARARRWKYGRFLERAADTVQVGTSATKRKEQAERAYVAVGDIDKNKVYVLLDDVWTTGASMLSAAKVLWEAGAQEVFGVVLVTGNKKSADEESPAD